MADEEEVATNWIYNVVALAIFAMMSCCLLFPCNSLIPLDRRTAAVFGTTLCYITRTFLFSSKTIDVVDAIDFDVLVLLASIMVINYLVIHLKETKKSIEALQRLLKSDPIKGFWMISLVSFVVSPFLTNDGVCLLFVEPLMQAFDDPTEISHSTLMNSVDNVDALANDNTENTAPKMKLETKDAIFFLLSLACSANIGSALTYTGNPQNMIVSQDAVDVMPPWLFFVYQLVPSILAWLMTTAMIQYRWGQSHQQQKQHLLASDASASDHSTYDALTLQNSTHISDKVTEEDPSTAEYAQLQCREDEVTDSGNGIEINPLTGALKRGDAGEKIVNVDVECGNDIVQHNSIRMRSSPLKTASGKTDDLDVYSPGKLHSLREDLVLSSPVPYVILVLLALMIIMIFVNVMTIAALVCTTAMVMILIMAVGSHWRGRVIFGTNKGRRNISQEEKLENLTHFFEEIFDSIDYSLLLIFLGTFVVVANVESTLLPKQLWSMIVGKTPFNTVTSAIGISIFVLVVSQFLGNVAVIQMAKSNIEPLGDDQKRYAWALVSYVATVGGNLTLTGSAANIIVAEKVRRIDPSNSLDFFRHFRVCFAVTLLSCFVGGVILTWLVAIGRDPVIQSW